MILNRSSHQRCSIKKAVLRNFAKLTWKYLCQSLSFFPTLLKKRLWLKCFPVNFAKFLRTPLLQNTSGWLLLTKLHDPNRRKMRFPCFELRWLLNVWTCHGILCFHFYFFCLETTLWESNWMKTASAIAISFFRKYLITATKLLTLIILSNFYMLRKS